MAGATFARAPSRLALVLVLSAGVVAIASSAPLIRTINTRAAISGAGAAVSLAAFRMMVATLLTAPAALKDRRTLPPALWPTASLAGLALALHFATWITSLSYTSMAASTAIVTTNPVWVTLITVVLTKKLPSRSVLVGLAVALAGGVIIALSDSGASGPSRSPLLGDFLALFGALCATGYYLFTRKLQDRGATLRVSLGAVYASAMLWLIPALIFSAAHAQALLSPSVIIWVILLGILPQWIGHSAFHWAMQFISPTVVTTVILLEPVGAALLGWLIFREAPPAMTYLGALVLLLGVLFVVRGDGKH